MTDRSPAPESASSTPPSIDAIIEGLLFTSDHPRSVRDIATILADLALQQSPDSERQFEEDLREVQSAITRIAQRYEQTSDAVRLVEVAGGWEFRTRVQLAPFLRPTLAHRRIKLGRAALEVLAVVAYRQPCTRADVDDVRGVDSSSTLRNLVKFDLLRVIGRADDVGRPLVYGTSDAFLRFFSLDRLEDLPTLKEFSELSEEHMLTLAELDEMRAQLESSPTADGDDGAHRA